MFQVHANWMRIATRTEPQASRAGNVLPLPARNQLAGRVATPWFRRLWGHGFRRAGKRNATAA